MNGQITAKAAYHKLYLNFFWCGQECKKKICRAIIQIIYKIAHSGYELISIIYFNKELKQKGSQTLFQLVGN